MATSRWTAAAAEVQPVSLRRRGLVLERAILDSALEQLSTVGWNALTMEGVAAGAQTGKAAIYRRWPSKEDLVADALRSALPVLDQVPDGGSIREDLYELCRQVRGAMFSTSGSALRSVIHECDSELAERFHGVIVRQVIEPSNRLFREAVRRGVERGDVRPDATSDLLFDVVPGLLMYRSKVCGSEWPDEEIAEMVDRIMVPLLRPTGG
ncbi:TetR/AcrR family transcriptional regulator [Streptomyces sp. NPDC054887]